MSQQFKDYYKILGVAQDASLYQIQQAYKKAANHYHPERHTTNRSQYQRKFSQISEAFRVLSDNQKRFKYDEILHKGYALDQANQTFEKFFSEHDFVNQEEEKFFDKHYPQRPRSSYEILGVPKNATLNEIKNAYRKLALQYHPKNNGNSQQSQRKFVEINKAFDDISDPRKRQIYDQWLYGEMAPIKANSIFEDFYKFRPEQIPHQEDFFKPLLKKKWSWGLDKMMEDENDFGSNIDNGEVWKESTVYSNHNGVQTKKLVRRKRRIVNGKAEEVKTQEYLLPTGQRQIVRTIESEGKSESTKFTFKKGEEVPLYLSQ